MRVAAGDDGITDHMYGGRVPFLGRVSVQVQGCGYRDMTVLASVTQYARDNVLGVILRKDDALAIRELEIGTSAYRARLGFRALCFFHSLERSRKTNVHVCSLLRTLRKLGLVSLRNSLVRCD
jgi:hypothetical protein